MKLQQSNSMKPDSEPTITIRFENLAVLEHDEEGTIRVALSRLEEDSHIHGGLRIMIDGRTVPYTGFFDEDDACFGYWIIELNGVIQAFEESESAKYVYDEGEQGQPAFVFERQGETVYFSINDSEITDGKADLEWQRVAFPYNEFHDQYLRFQRDFASEVRRSARVNADKWLKQFRL